MPRWDRSSSRLGIRVPRMHRAMLQVTKPPLSPARLLPLAQGLHPPQDCPCTHTPRLCGTSSNGTRADGWMQPEQAVTQHPSHGMGRITGPLGPPLPSNLPPERKAEPPHCRTKGKATTAAELTLQSRNKPSSSGHSWLQQQSPVSPARPADPKTPKNRPQPPQPPTSSWAQTCRKCYCNINN